MPTDIVTGRQWTASLEPRALADQGMISNFIESHHWHHLEAKDLFGLKRTRPLLGPPVSRRH